MKTTMLDDAVNPNNSRRMRRVLGAFTPLLLAALANAQAVDGQGTEPPPREHYRKLLIRYDPSVLRLSADLLGGLLSDAMWREVQTEVLGNEHSKELRVHADVSNTDESANQPPGVLIVGLVASVDGALDPTVDEQLLRAATARVGRVVNERLYETPMRSLQERLAAANQELAQLERDCAASAAGPPQNASARLDAVRARSAELTGQRDDAQIEVTVEEAGLGLAQQQLAQAQKALLETPEGGTNAEARTAMAQRAVQLAAAVDDITMKLHRLHARLDAIGKQLAQVDGSMHEAEDAARRQAAWASQREQCEHKLAAARARGEEMAARLTALQPVQIELW